MEGESAASRMGARPPWRTMASSFASLTAKLAKAAMASMATETLLDAASETSGGMPPAAAIFSLLCTLTPTFARALKSTSKGRVDEEVRPLQRPFGTRLRNTSWLSGGPRAFRRTAGFQEDRGLSGGPRAFRRTAGFQEDRGLSGGPRLGKEDLKIEAAVGNPDWGTWCRAGFQRVLALPRGSWPRPYQDGPAPFQGGTNWTDLVQQSRLYDAASLTVSARRLWRPLLAG
ncbi:hypothetical protein M885DRAFT_12979 [Pelagophyceae sp. CCMP2097]|nr:hypothetical protein M885DRAFT_12979 [Pelagophyceae sp. CCMP2097]